MTNILPLLENGLFVTNFQTKADIFNELFVQQRSLNSIRTGGEDVFHKVRSFLPTTLEVIKVHSQNLLTFF